MANRKPEARASRPLVPEIGKVPPQAPDLEEAVLGAIMLEKEAAISVLDLLKPNYFYKETNQKIFTAIAFLASNDMPVDLYTVTERLKATNDFESVGGVVYLTELTMKVVSAAHIEYHAKIVAQKFIQRELIRVSTEIQTRSYDDSYDVTDLIDFSESELFAVAEGTMKRDVVPINAVIRKALHEMEEAGKKEDHLIGVPSGFTKLDRLTTGWQRSDLIIIAARPSMGKTAFALSMARNMAVEHDKKVAIFSLEMSAIQLVNRLIVAETEIPSDKIKTGRLTQEEWSVLDNKLKRLMESPIHIDDTPAITIFELRAKCRRLKAQHKLDIIIVDYLQLMTGPHDSGTREQEVSAISRSLKAIAKELDVPILALSQLNRSVETRTGNKRPMLSDLRESGAIEQDADMVIFIHRQEKMGIHQTPEGNPTKGIAEIILAKNRNGPVDDVILRFREEKATFEDMEDFEMEGSEGFGTTMTFGSKMNNDLGRFSGDFNNGGSNAGEPPFA